jgi:hypothetical protein
MALDINEWEIWHTYSTFLHATTIDLRETARRLVASGLAECAMLRDGETFWRTKDSVGSGTTIIDIDPVSDRSTFTLSLDEGCRERPEGFALEGWGQAACFVISERTVLGDASGLPPPYLRAYLGKCELTSIADDNKRSQLNLYPVLLVYESGVLIVEFRMIGPTTVTSLPNFINGGVNLFRYRFDSVTVIPGLSSFATRAYHQSGQKINFFGRVRLAWLQAGHDIAVRQRTEKREDEAFSFDLAPLSGSEANDLRAIALTIFHTAAFVIGRPRLGLAFVVWGQSPVPLLGEFWSGRPHVHIVRFSDQHQTATENEVCHGNDFARILARAPNLDSDQTKVLLPKNARLFEDYGAYITSACSLWVWSLKGLEREQPRMDPNRGNLIYERQVLAELLEYGYMLHRSLYHRVENFKTTAEVIEVRKSILQLRLKMREVSHSGEIRDLLERGWNEMGLPYLASEIDASLQLRSSETSSIEALRNTRVGWALTIVFGFVAVPALADQVILPLWKLTSFHQFDNPDVARVAADGIAMLFVLLVVWMTVFLFSPSKR